MHYLNHGRRANGHVEVAVDLACEQAHQRHDVHFVSGPCDFVETLQANGVSFHLVPEEVGAARSLKMAKALYGVCRSVRPDVINAHMVAAALASALIRPVCRFKLATTVHNSFDRQSIAMRVGDRVIAVSEAVKSEMHGKWVPLRKLRVVHNGVIGGARRPFYPLARSRLEHPAIVTVAGLHPRKGIGDLLEAFDRVFRKQPAAHLYIVGDGPFRQAYEKQAQGQASGRSVHFLGHSNDPREVLADADIFVLASLKEPFALVLGEARQMGCAIVATAVGGNAEALWQGQKGKLVPASDPAALGSAILGFIDDEAERARYAAAAGRDTDDIMVERMARETVSVYEDMLAGSRFRRRGMRSADAARPGAPAMSRGRDARST